MSLTVSILWDMVAVARLSVMFGLILSGSACPRTFWRGRASARTVWRLRFPAMSMHRSNAVLYLNVDIVGPLPECRGMKYLFTMVDRFTRWIEVVPMSSMTAPDCARAFLTHWISRYGVPADVTTDQGR